MTEHQERADQVDAQIDDLQRESDRLKERIGDTRDDWEAKKTDAKVPGADGEPEAADPGEPDRAEGADDSSGEEPPPE